MASLWTQADYDAVRRQFPIGASVRLSAAGRRAKQHRDSAKAVRIGVVTGHAAAWNSGGPGIAVRWPNLKLSQMYAPEYLYRLENL